MKNETARREIESLDYYLQKHTNDYSEESHTAMMMAVKALEQQPCEDCISRQMVIDAVTKIHPVDTEYDSTLYDKIDVMYVLKDSPSVTPKPKIGHWEDCSNGWMCSNCYKDVSHESDFCPHCGAKMAESEKQGCKVEGSDSE